MRVIEGHLTAADRKAVSAIMDAGMNEGKVGRASYSISHENGVYTVVKAIKDRGLIPVPGSEFRISRYTSKFVI